MLTPEPGDAAASEPDLERAQLAKAPASMAFATAPNDDDAQPGHRARAFTGHGFRVFKELPEGPLSSGHRKIGAIPGS